MSERVTWTIEGGVADVRLNRPDKMNALDPAMIEGLLTAIDTLGQTAGLRAVVLSGEGRAFCAGLDMASMANVGAGVDIAARTHGLANSFQQVAWGWRTLPVPVIAAVHGVAFGGGLQIASGADIRVAAPETRLSVMELKWGIVPDMAGFALWRGTVRDDVLRELTYTAREFDAAEAQTFGFVTRLVDDPHADARDGDGGGRGPDAAPRHLLRRARRPRDPGLRRHGDRRPGHLRGAAAVLLLDRRRARPEARPDAEREPRVDGRGQPRPLRGAGHRPPPGCVLGGGRTRVLRP